MEFPSFERRRRRPTFFLTAIALSGCATVDPVCDQDCDTSYAPVSSREFSLPDRDPEKSHRKQFEFYQGAPWSTTVTLEGRVTEREWVAIDQNRVFVGMSELAATYSMGVPSHDSRGPLVGFLLHYAPVVGNVWQEEGHWGLRRIYIYDCLGNTPERTCAPPDAWEDLGIFDKRSRRIWVFTENGVVVNYNHGRLREIYKYEDSEDSWWSGLEHVKSDYQRLPPPPNGVFYAMPQNGDSGQDGMH